ncbi:MAG: 3-hydroxyacyl-CoA dehydrogenase [Ponticaulis sp.]|nr:3-hydroxyacyl-CoA dehydrogenase [Ponticaulis sp.]
MNGLHFLKHPQWEREDVLANSPRPDGARGVFDGVDIDRTSGHIFFSDMGVMNQRDGAIYRCDRDGQTIRTVVEPGGSFTPKQLKIDQQSRKLYWSDREGMAVMRCNNDGSGVETLVRIGDPVENKGDQTRWCVGMALDPARQQIYWSQKGGDNAGQGVIRRCGMELPEGETPDNRSDIETLFAGLPEPIDLDLDLEARMIYWTDRGDNTVSRAPMDLPPSPNPFARNDRDILVTGLQEAIGIALLPSVKRMAFTSLGGEVGISNMDGSDLTLLQQDVRPLTGIAWWA